MGSRRSMARALRCGEGAKGMRRMTLRGPGARYGWRVALPRRFGPQALAHDASCTTMAKLTMVIEGYREQRDSRNVRRDEGAGFLDAGIPEARARRVQYRRSGNSASLDMDQDRRRVISVADAVTAASVC
jgi:hypothetical protein